MFLRHFLFYLLILLANFQSYDEKLCCLFIPGYIVAYCCIYRTFLKMRKHLAPLPSLSIILMFITGHVEPEQTSFEVCMLLCFNICSSIIYIMYNFSLGCSMYIFILQAHDDVIWKQFIDIETPITLVVFIIHYSCRGDSWFQLLEMCNKS